MSKNIFGNFITGMDVSPEVNLTEGYVSAWYHPKEKDVLYIRSRQLEDGKYQFESGYFSRNYVWPEFKEMKDKEAILEYSGMSEYEFLNQGACGILFTCSSYNGWFFDGTGERIVDTLEEVISAVISVEGDLTFKEMPPREQHKYLLEVGLTNEAIFRDGTEKIELTILTEEKRENLIRTAVEEWNKNMRLLNDSM